MAVQVIAGRMIDHYVVEFPGGSEVLCARGIGIEMDKESNLLYGTIGIFSEMHLALQFRPDRSDLL